MRRSQASKSTSIHFDHRSSDNGINQSRSESTINRVAELQRKIN